MRSPKCESDDGSTTFEDPSMYNLDSYISRRLTLRTVTRSITATRLGITNEPNPAQYENLKRVTYYADLIWDEWGALHVSSGLRVPALNDRIPGSSTTSAHCYGAALDFIPLNAPILEVFEWIADRITSSPKFDFDQLILEYPPNGWIHLGLRVNGRTPRNQVLMKLRGQRFQPYDRTKL